MSRLAVVLFSVLLPYFASAQYNFHCTDIRGIPVAAVPRHNFGDSAMATMVNGMPVIWYDPTLLGSMPTQVQIFAYAHECGHHVVGGVLKIMQGGSYTVADEQQADCWGIVTAVKQGLLDDSDVTVIQNFFRNSPGDAHHFPGPIRSMNLRACLDAAGVTPKGQHQAAPPNNDDDTSSTGVEQCKKDYNECIEEIPSEDECKTKHYNGCMADCMGNYHYPYVACQQQFCNPYSHDSTWAAQCSQRSREKKNSCKDDLDTCKSDLN